MSLDNLFSDEIDDSKEISYIPKKCADCKTATVCSAFAYLVSLTKIGVKITIDECDYCIPNKT